MIWNTTKKRIYLNKGREKEKKQRKPIELKVPFFTALVNHELPINLTAFIGISLVSGILLMFIYRWYTRSDIVSTAGLFIGFMLPYLIMETPLMISKHVDNALQYKEFINTLQSSLKATNSTHEALFMVSKEKGLNREMSDIMKQITSDLTLGESVESALDKAIDKSRNTYLKMALSIVKINHNIGSNKTIASLDNILKAQDLIMDNISLLKDKINSIVLEKACFLLAIVACPVLHFTLLSDFMGDFYQVSIWQWTIVLILVVACAGSFLMNRSALKSMDEI